MNQEKMRPVTIFCGWGESFDTVVLVLQHKSIQLFRPVPVSLKDFSEQSENF